MHVEHLSSILAGAATTRAPVFSPSAIWEVLWRAVLFYVIGMLLIRFGKRRLLGRSTAFDIVLGFLLGSLLSRAINGSGPVLPTIAAGILLVFMHWLIGWISFRWPALATMVKGARRHLIRDGRFQEDAMRTSELSEDDLREELRLKAQMDEPGDVRAACLERNGQISFLPRRGEAKVLEVRVEEGVQTVRIEVV